MSRQERYVLWAMCLGYGMVVLDTTALNVALPTIRADIGASAAQGQWIVDAYVVVLSALLLVGGRIIDALGVKFAFRVGVILFGCASAACAVANGPGLLIGCRVVQGVGGALLVPATLAALRVSFTDDTRARALAVVAAVSASPQAFGPTVGGLLVGWAGWRSVFLMNIPLGVVTFVLAASMAKGSRSHREKGALALIGEAVLTGAAMGAVAYAIISGANADWRPAIASGVVATAILVWIVRQVGRSAFDVIPKPVVAGAGALPTIFVGTFLFVAYYGALFSVSLYFQGSGDFSASEIGLCLIPIGTPVFLMPLLMNRYAADRSPLTLTLIGTTIAVLGSLVGMLVAATGARSILPSILAATLIGIGVGVCTTAQLRLVIEEVPAAFAGSASAIANSARQFGTLVGVAFAGAAASGAAGYRFSWAAVVCGAAAAVLLTVTATARRSRLAANEANV